MITNLSSQYISSSFQGLLQVSSSGRLYDGTGSLISAIAVTASFSNISYAIPTSAPLIPVTGSIYFNTGSNKLYIYAGNGVTGYKTSSLG
jgi:hypothetical protein